MHFTCVLFWRHTHFSRDYSHRCRLLSWTFVILGCLAMLLIAEIRLEFSNISAKWTFPNYTLNRIFFPSKRIKRNRRSVKFDAKGDKYLINFFLLKLFNENRSKSLGSFGFFLFLGLVAIRFWNECMQHNNLSDVMNGHIQKKKKEKKFMEMWRCFWSLCVCVRVLASSRPGGNCVAKHKYPT